MVIPEIKEGIIENIINWADKIESLNELIERLNVEQPVLMNYLVKVRDNLDEEAAFIGLIVFRMIESQTEANELKELIG